MKNKKYEEELIALVNEPKEINIKIDLDFDVNMQLWVLDGYYTWLHDNSYDANYASVYQAYRNLLIERAKKE